jgi:hypothetical protein
VSTSSTSSNGFVRGSGTLRPGEPPPRCFGLRYLAHWHIRTLQAVATHRNRESRNQRHSADGFQARITGLAIGGILAIQVWQRAGQSPGDGFLRR